MSAVLATDYNRFEARSLLTVDQCPAGRLWDLKLAEHGRGREARHLRGDLYKAAAVLLHRTKRWCALKAGASGDLPRDFSSNCD